LTIELSSIVDMSLSPSASVSPSGEKKLSSRPSCSWCSLSSCSKTRRFFSNFFISSSSNQTSSSSSPGTSALQKRYTAVAAPPDSATMTIGHDFCAAWSMLSRVPGPPCTTTCTIGTCFCVE